MSHTDTHTHRHTHTQTHTHTHTDTHRHTHTHTDRHTHMLVVVQDRRAYLGDAVTVVRRWVPWASMVDTEEGRRERER